MLVVSLSLFNLVFSYGLYAVWSDLDAQIVRSYWQMARILSRTWDVDFALDDEREETKLQKESCELVALISKL